MRKRMNRASALALGAIAIAALIIADTGVAARDIAPALIITEPQPAYVPNTVIQPLAETDGQPGASSIATLDDSEQGSAPQSADTLAELVAAQPEESLSRELDCLAGAIYFEAKSESLPGQLAVGRVVVARSRSGRFPGSYCGVVFQPSQFSFVRGRVMPPVNRSSRQWKNAAAIARIADSGSWQSPVEGALFFHAARVSPGWRLTRVGRLENHIFYR